MLDPTLAKGQIGDWGVSGARPDTEQRGDSLTRRQTSPVGRSRRGQGETRDPRWTVWVTRREDTPETS